MRVSRLRWLVLFVGLVSGLLFLNPNPFGDTPEAVHDESTFLTTSLTALQQHTIPGWVFSSASSWYNGINTLLFYILLIPVLVIGYLNFLSFDVTLGWVFQHTGDLVHLLRLINGAWVLAAIAAIVLGVSKIRGGQYRTTGLLLLTLVLSNPLFVGMAHTGKGWVLTVLLDAAAGLLFFLQSSSIDRGEPLLDRKSYASILLWLVFLSMIQAVTGILTGVWILLALFFKQIDWKDLWRALKKYWLWLGLIAVVTTPSIMFAAWNTMIKGNHASLTNVTTSGYFDSDGSINWTIRLFWPIKTGFLIHPLLSFNWIVLVIVAFWKKTSHWLRAMLLVPVLLYVGYFAIAGFGTFPRYLLPLTISMAVVVTAAIFELRWHPKILLGLYGLLAALILVKTAWLFWQPASESDLRNTLTQSMNSPSTLILDATRPLNLPLNVASLAYLNHDRPLPKRLMFYEQHPDILSRFVTLKSVVIKEGVQKTPPPEILKQFAVWKITEGCQTACRTDEPPTSCITFNRSTCDVQDAFVQEGTTLYDLFVTQQLGRVYTLRKMQ